MLQLFGTPTSPYVRRVRVTAIELGLPLELVDTRQEAGQAALRAASPIWKVPVLAGEGREPLLDSRVICAALVREHGPGPLRVPSDPDLEANLVNVADGALDALINAFYLQLDGVDPASVPYLVKQRERAAACVDWLAGRLRGVWLTEEEKLGPAEVALQTALDWMVFRDRHPVDADPRLAAFRAFHGARPSFEETFPRV